MKKLQLNWVEKEIMMPAFHKMQAKNPKIHQLLIWTLEHD